MSKTCRIEALCAAIFSLALLLGSLWAPQARADNVPLGDAANFGLLFEGNGNNTLQITNVTVNGNIGVGLTGLATIGGPATVNGTIYFSAGNTGQFSNNNAADVFGGPVYNSTSGPFNVTGALNTVNTLNAALGAASGTNININGNTTINESAGMLQTVNGVTYRVFNVTGFNTTNSNVLTIKGDGSGIPVVLNFTGNVNFNNQVALSGLTAGQVLYNFVGGSGLTGGPTLQINDNASSSASNIVQGIFLDPNGAISIVNANVLGDVFGGDTHDFQYVSGSTLTSVNVPEPSALVLLAAGLFAVMGLMARRRLQLA